MKFLVGALGADSHTARRLVAASEESRPPVSLVAMKKRFLIGALAFGILAFALAGWTVDGVRWALSPRLA